MAQGTLMDATTAFVVMVRDVKVVKPKLEKKYLDQERVRIGDKCLKCPGVVRWGYSILALPFCIPQLQQKRYSIRILFLEKVFLSHCIPFLNLWNQVNEQNYG